MLFVCVDLHFLFAPQENEATGEHGACVVDAAMAVAPPGSGSVLVLRLRVDTVAVQRRPAFYFYG